jgi:hypothetical protein
VFARVALAFQTLSDPVARHLYDTEGVFTRTKRKLPLLKTGNEAFEAMEIAREYSDVIDIYLRLPELEATYEIPAGELRFGAGVSAPAFAVTD